MAAGSISVQAHAPSGYSGPLSAFGEGAVMEAAVVLFPNTAARICSKRQLRGVASEQRRATFPPSWRHPPKFAHFVRDHYLAVPRDFTHIGVRGHEVDDSRMSAGPGEEADCDDVLCHKAAELVDVGVRKPARGRRGQRVANEFWVRATHVTVRIQQHPAATLGAIHIRLDALCVSTARIDSLHGAGGGLLVDVGLEGGFPACRAAHDFGQ